MGKSTGRLVIWGERVSMFHDLLIYTMLTIHQYISHVMLKVQHKTNSVTSKIPLEYRHLKRLLQCFTNIDTNNYSQYEAIQCNISDQVH